MKGLKRFTQSITMIIVIPITVFFIPWIMARLLQLTGFWSVIDSLFPEHLWWYWSIFIITRYAFAGVWYFFGHFFVKYGRKYNFFWFEENDPYHTYRKPTVDKSWEIFVIAFIAVIVLVIAELAIYLSTGLIPPFSQ